MNYCCRLLVSYLVVTLILPSPAKANEDEEECVRKLVDSCKAADYSHYGSGSSILTATSRLPSGKQAHIYCISDADGTSCNLNHSPWFTCSTDHTATYKGSILSTGSTDGADDEICFTAEKLGSGSDENIFALYEAKLAEDKKKLQENMAKLHERLEEMKKDFKDRFRSCFPFCDHNPFGPGFPFNN